MFWPSNIFLFFYLLVLFIYSRSANIRPVHSNWALSSFYHYKTRPLTTDWLQVCFGTRPLLLIACECILGHAPYYWLPMIAFWDTPLTADWLRVCFGIRPLLLIGCECVLGYVPYCWLAANVFWDMPLTADWLRVCFWDMPLTADWLRVCFWDMPLTADWLQCFRTRDNSINVCYPD